MYKLKLKVGKSKTGNVYRALCIDLGYRYMPVCFKDQDIAEVLGVTVRDLVEKYKLDGDMPVAYFDVE